MLNFQIELERQNNLSMFLNSDSVKDNPRVEILRSFIDAQKGVLTTLENLPGKDIQWLLDVFYSYQESQRKVLVKILEESVPDLPAKHAVLRTFFPHCNTNEPKLDVVIEEERQDNLSRFLRSTDSSQKAALVELISTQKELLRHLKISPNSRNLDLYLTNYNVQKFMLSVILAIDYPHFPDRRSVLGCLLPQKNTPEVNRPYFLAQNSDTTFFSADGQKRQRLGDRDSKVEQDFYDVKSFGQ